MYSRRKSLTPEGMMSFMDHPLQKEIFKSYCLREPLLLSSTAKVLFLFRTKVSIANWIRDSRRLFGSSSLFDSRRLPLSCVVEVFRLLLSLLAGFESFCVLLSLDLSDSLRLVLTGTPDSLRLLFTAELESLRLLLTGTPDSLRLFGLDILIFKAWNDKENRTEWNEMKLFWQIEN